MENISNNSVIKDNLWKNVKNLQLINNIIKLGNQTSDLHILFDKILEILMSNLGFNIGGIYFVDQINKIAKIFHHKNLTEEMLISLDNIDINQYPYNKIFFDGKPLFSENYHEVNPERAKKYGISSIASIPLKDKNIVIGAINLGVTDKSIFTEEEKELLQVICTEIGTVITKIKTEIDLKKQKNNFQSLFGALSDMVFVIDYEGNILQTNQRVLKKLGYSMDEILTMNIIHIYSPTLSEVVKNMISSMVSEAETTFTMPIITKNREKIFVEISSSKMYWNNTKVLINTCRDISDRKKIQETLENKEKEISRLRILESEVRYYNILETTNEGYYETDLEGNFVFLNNKFCDIFGYSKLSLLNKKYGDFIKIDEKRRVFEAFNRVYNNGIEESEFIQAFSVKNGLNKILQISIYLKYDSLGNKIGFCGAIKDITDKVVQERLIHESQEELKKRYKELNCLYGITKITEDPDLELEDILQGTLHFIHFAWEIPRVVHIKINYKDIFYKTIGFKQTEWSVSTRQQIGKNWLIIEIYSQEPRDFEKQEIALITELGTRLKTIIEKKEVEKKLKTSEKRYRTILENMEDGYYEIDNKGNITFANKATGRLLGYTNDALIGKNFKQFTDKETGEMLLNTYKNIFNIGFGIQALDYEIVNKRGEQIFLETSAYLKYDNEGNKIGFHGVLRDITDRKKSEVLKEEFSKKLEEEVRKKTLKLNEALEKQKFYINQILKSSQFKTNFMSTMSHELRTPLNSIIGFSDLLLEKGYGPLNEMQIDFLEDIRNSADHLLEMINHILDISKIEAGKLTLNRELFQLKNLFDQIHGTIKPLYSLKNLKFNIIGLDDKMMIYADPIRTKEILLNLLSNAIKFTLSGEINLIVEEKYDAFIFKVKDTGIGIARKDFDLIFKDFKRVNSPIINSIPGSGLGLSLTKRLINLHGGEISFFSILGKGTTFTFSIPKEN